MGYLDLDVTAICLCAGFSASGFAKDLALRKAEAHSPATASGRPRSSHSRDLECCYPQHQNTVTPWPRSGWDLGVACETS